MQTKKQSKKDCFRYQNSISFPNGRQGNFSPYPWAATSWALPLEAAARKFLYLQLYIISEYFTNDFSIEHNNLY
jgi:hypothetical protein